MNDMHQGLSQTLRGAVPDAPSLTGLAARAEADGRRRRGKRRAVVAGGAAALLVVLASSLALNPDRRPEAASDNPTSTPVTAVGCDIELHPRTGDRVRRAPVTTDPVPVSVRFCAPIRNQPGGERVSAVVPDTALTTDVPATVAALEDTLRRSSGCAAERNLYRIQIAYDNGAVRDLQDSVCDEGFPVLLEAIGRQQAQRYGKVGADVSCADQSVRARSGNFFPNEPLQLLTRFPAVAAVRCEGTIGNQAQTTVIDPEALRAALLSDVTPGIADCETRPALPTVTWVLLMADGTRHVATFDRRSCGALVFDNDGAGIGGRLLRDLAP